MSLTEKKLFSFLQNTATHGTNTTDGGSFRFFSKEFDKKIEIAESENHLRRIGDFLIFLLGYNEPC